MATSKVNLETGTYEIIKNRLQEQSAILSERLNLLNEGRKAVFNTEQFALIANQRITTEHNGVARGIIALEDLCIFAYNVHFGLREEINLNDVFSIYQFKDNHFEPLSLELIQDEQFESDFKNLYKYYREAFFSKFYRTPNYLYMIFQTSKDVADRKAFKWYIDGDQLKYIDDRSIHEVKNASQYGFIFTKTSLEDRRLGVHPHISIKDKLFIEAIGGDITFKIEDNTSTGLGIYAEPVENKDQQLDDAQFYYADLGNLIALKIQPYQEDFRAYIYNVRTKEVHNIPSLLESGILLPDEQGIIFSNGYYLQNGTFKLFENNIDQLEYMRTIAAPNGEDYLYIYYQKHTNTYVLLSYNVILQEVNTPIICNGFTIFKDGKLIYFRTEKEAIRHHQVQIWQTPYTASLVENPTMQENVLYKIGNKDIVSAMAETNEILQLVKKEDSYEGLYEDISRHARVIADSYFWLNDPKTYDLASPLLEIATIADTAIDEFAKVQAQIKFASDEVHAKQQEVVLLAQRIRNEKIEAVDQMVQLLNVVRLTQGGVIALKDIRYINLEQIEVLQSELQSFNEQLSQSTVDFLLQDNALDPYRKTIQQQKKTIEKISKVVEAKSLEEEITSTGIQLELLIDILNSLKIEDTTQTTRIIEQISVLFSSINEVKAALQRKISGLKSKEAVGEFHAQMTLLEQSIVNFLDLSDTVEKCDSYQTKISVHIEELESKFADFEEFVIKIADKRDEVLKAFQGKKEMLVSQMNKRTGSLEQIGLRVLKSIENKAQTYASSEEILSFFAGDLMIEKIRNLSQELTDLGDVGKAENLLNALKLAQEQAIRTLKDKQELFVDGQQVILLGQHRFAVNTQSLALTIVQRDGKLFYHLMGTNFYQAISNHELDAYKSVWDQDYSSENASVYRSAYLGFQAFKAYQKDGEIDIQAFINSQIEQDYAGGYVKGVHNVDAETLFLALKKTDEQLELLRYAPSVRAHAWEIWMSMDDETRKALTEKIQNAHQVHQFFGRHWTESVAYTNLLEYVQEELPAINVLTQTSIATYLVEELKTPHFFTCSSTASHLKEDFVQYLTDKKEYFNFEKQVLQASWNLTEKWVTIQDWMAAFAQYQNLNIHADYLEEAALLLLLQNTFQFEVKKDASLIEIEDLKGSHGTINNGTMSINFHDFLKSLSHFQNFTAKQFTAFQDLKRQLIQSYEKHLKISEMQAKPLSSFMRNRLINEVYFPMIGANLSKQLGTVGNDKKTARMGMLLLISPPGYGKTTLMEYLAATMGLHFVKINGPTIGHRIYSIDPSEATTSGARAELEKLNLAFEMEDNVMLYIDDIQHCSPEFLQQFISLADGQRKIDGIFNGEAKTYDLRGKRFCVVMAGNPYTESGTKFKIPDMLANRSDVYNLGDVAGTSRSLFELSLIENCINDNRFLQHIAHKNIDDLYALINYVVHKQTDLPDLKSNVTSAEVNDAIAVLHNLLQARDVVLQVNDLYIESAGMQDAYRTEPAFKLQGSYRNMSKLASKIVPLMNRQELQQLVLTHYEAEAQTLTTDAEANLLKLKTIMQVSTQEEQQRYDHILTTFRKNNEFAGMDQSDQSAKVLSQLAGINNHFKTLVELFDNKKGN